MPLKAAAVFDDSTAASATKRLAAVAMACDGSAMVVIRRRRRFWSFCGLWVVWRAKVAKMARRTLLQHDSRLLTKKSDVER